MDTVVRCPNADVYCVDLVPHSCRVILPFKVNMLDARFQRFIVDTGNPTTMVSTYVVKQLGGYELKMQGQDLSIPARVAGNMSSLLYPYIIPKVYLGKFEVTNMFVYAGDLIGELDRNGLLGLNFLDCLVYAVSRHSGEFHFHQKTPNFLPNKVEPFRNYFNYKTSEYVSFVEAAQED